MPGSAFGRVQVSSLVKGVFPDGQQTRYDLYYRSKNFTWNLLHFFYFSAFAVPKCLYLYE